jgi:hypothetical protein
MKQKLLLPLLLLTAWAAQAQTLLQRQSFEGTGTDALAANAYTATTVATTSPNIYFYNATLPVPGFNTAPNQTSTVTAIDGTHFWASENVRRSANNTPRGNPPANVTLTPLNVAGKSNLSVKVALADASGRPGNNGIRWETDDFVRVQYRFNGTGDWNTIGQFVGDGSNGGGPPPSGALRQDLYPCNDVADPGAPVLNQTLTDYTFPIPGAGNTLEVRVEIDQDGASEEFGFDNIRVYGSAAASAAPVLSSVEATALTYNEGNAGKNITSSLTVSDDGATLSGGVVSISRNFQSGEDLLLFTNQNNITGSYSTMTGVLTLSGSSSLANYQTALRSIQYQNSDAIDASPLTRTVSFSVTDATGVSSNIVQRAIEVTAALDAASGLPYVEPFETDGEGTRYASNHYFSQDAAQFQRTNANPTTTGAAGTTFSNIAGSYYWVGVNTTPPTLNPTGKNNGTLTTKQVNTAGYTNLHFQLRIGASASINNGNLANWLTSDYFQLFYRLSGTSTWTAFGLFRGTGTGTSGGVIRQDSNPNGTGAPTGTQLRPALQNFDFALPASLNGQTLDFQLVLANADGVNYLAFDQLQVTGTLATTLTSIVRASTTPTNAAVVNYTVTFGAPVMGLTAANFTLTTTGTVSGASVGTPTAGAGNTWTVPVNTGSGSGTLRLNLDNATNLSPGISTPLPVAGETYTIDRTAPEVLTVGLPAAATYPIGQALRFTVNFSEAVTVTGTPQLPLRIGGIRKLASYVSGSGGTALVFQYTVQSGDNDINGVNPADLELNGGTIRDAVTNAALLRLNGVPTSGVLIDGVAPTVTSLTGPAASGSTLSGTPFVFSALFSEAVTNFSASGISVTNGSVTSGPTGSGAGPYTFIVTPATPGTATSVTIGAGAAKDVVGNPSVALDPYLLTYLPPNVTVTALVGRTPTPTATSTVSYKVTFSGDVTGLNTSNFNVTTTGGVSGASVASVLGSGASYVVVVNTGTGDGTLRLNLNNSTGTAPGISGLPNTSGFVYQLSRTNTFGPNPLLTIQGSGSASGSTDVTAFVDLVQVLSGSTPVAGALQNNSFETNNVGPASYAYSPQVSATPWVFNTQAGVARNGSAFGAAVPPNGDAVAFIQSSPTNNGSLAQNLTLAGGSYQVSLQASQRACCGTGPRDQELYVLVNGVCLGIVQPATSDYTPFTSLAFNVRSTSRVAGQLLHFAGGATPGYVDFSADAANPAPLLGGTYTQIAWIKPTIGTGNATYYVLGNGNGITAAPYLAITGSGQLEAGFGTGSALRSVQTGPQTVASGVWSQVAATYDGSTLSVYLNGQLQATLLTNALPASTRVSFVGSAGPSGTNFFPGDLDEVSQWTRALPLAELRRLRHLTLNGSETGLVSYLQFNDSGTTTTDIIKGTVGTLTGATRLASTAPVGYGTSSLVSVTSSGNYAFAGTNAAINFTTSGADAYDVVVSRLEGLPLGTQPSATGLKQLYNAAYWIVDRYSATPFTANITYTLSPTDISATDAATPALFRLFKRGSNDDGAFDAAIAATAASAAASTVTFPVSSFSQTVIGTLNALPLPVELVRFTAELHGANALLRWTTASEKNNDHFEVEASTDGRTFRRLGQVPGFGSSSQPHDYQFVDPAIARYAASPIYYRLKQVDLDGTASYSPVCTVAPTGAEASLALFPNPTSRAAMLTGAKPGEVVQVFDALSRLVTTATADTTGTASLMLPQGLATGVYVVRAGSKALRLTVE